MGDMADWFTENGEDELIAHQMGNCDFGCRYCDAPSKPKKRKRRPTPSAGTKGGAG